MSPSFVVPQSPPHKRITGLVIRTSFPEAMKEIPVVAVPQSPDFPPAPPPSPSNSLSLESLSLGLPVLDFADCDLTLDTLPERFIPAELRAFEEASENTHTGYYSPRNSPRSPPRAPPPSPARRPSFRERFTRQGSWTPNELNHLMLACESGVELGWDEISELLPGHSASSCERTYHELRKTVGEEIVSPQSSIPYTPVQHFEQPHMQSPYPDSSDNFDYEDDSDMFLDLPALSRGPSPAPSPAPGASFDIDDISTRPIKRRRGDTLGSDAAFDASPIAFPLLQLYPSAKRCRLASGGGKALQSKDSADADADLFGLELPDCEAPWMLRCVGDAAVALDDAQYMRVW